MTTLIYRSLFLFFSFVILVSCGTTKKANNIHAKQLGYLPSEFHNTYLGMPLAAFKKSRVTAKPGKTEEFRSVFIEEFDKGDIKSVAYYFGTKEEMPLYEYVIDYHLKEKRDAFVASNLGKPNSGEEWSFDSNEGFKIKAWLFQNKLVVAGIIKDTEWYDETETD